jgi:hypothetical protein
MGESDAVPDGSSMSDAALISGRNGTSRLLAHIDLMTRLAVDEPVPAAERLEQALGRELAHTLVFALARPRPRPLDAAA